LCIVFDCVEKVPKPNFVWTVLVKFVLCYYYVCIR